MDIQHGFLLFFIGCALTFIGFFIAYLVANKVIMNKKRKKEKSPLDDLNKGLPGWKGDDCQ